MWYPSRQLDSGGFEATPCPCDPVGERLEGQCAKCNRMMCNRCRDLGYCIYCRGLTPKPIMKKQSQMFLVASDLTPTPEPSDE